MSNINARPNVSPQTAAWTTAIQAEVKALRGEINRLTQQVNITQQQLASSQFLLGDRGFKTEPAVYSESDSGSVTIVNGDYSNPVQYTSTGIAIPEGYTKALITMVGSLSAINSGVGSATITLTATPFFNVDPLGDPAGNQFLSPAGYCDTPLNNTGTAIVSLSADIDVTGGGSKLYFGLLSSFSGPTNGTITSADIRVSGSVTFYRE